MILIVLLLSGFLTSQAEDCPHLQSGLRKWSDAPEWPDGKIPAEGDDVVISDAVLLDQTTARLNTITIQSSGKLVWSPEGEITLTVSNVAIHGRFDIGSETCKLGTKARIILTGQIDTAPLVAGKSFQKAIGILPGGTLEIHGKRKLSWTKLTKTVPKTTAEGLISDFKVIAIANIVVATILQFQTNNKCDKGLYVFEFDATTGEMKTSTRHRTDSKNSAKVFDEFQTQVDGVAEGALVMIASCRFPFGDRADPTPMFESIERLVYGSVTGSGLIRSATPGAFQSYVVLAVKGSPSQSTEAFTSTADRDGGFLATLSKTFWDRNIKFTVESFVNDKGKGNYVDGRARTVETAYPILDLLDDASTWLPGDRIFLTATDFDYMQLEEAIVVSCTTCKPTQVRIELEPKFMHWGEVVQGVDERGEVAVLTRYITIEGEVQDTCPPANGNCDKYPFDTFGGHIKAHGAGFKNIHIEGAELYHVGQQTSLGNYPIHFHMSLDVDNSTDYPDPPYVRDNSIHHSFSRCVTIHGTSGVSLIDNVAYHIMGHCYFLEDGGERRNVLDGNLGASVQGGSLLPTDKDKTVSVFWITNPKNIVRNNVAAGCDGFGIWYVYPSEPFGPSKGLGMMRLHEARETPVWENTNNVAHSCEKAGFFIDHELEEDGNLDKYNRYNPKEEPLVEGSPPTQAVFQRITMYKNRHQNLWLRGGLITVTQSRAPVGSASKSQFLNTSILLGESANIGEPTLDSGIQYDRALPREGNPYLSVFGVRQNSGRVTVSDCWFNNFITTDVRPSSALGFRSTRPGIISPIQTTFNLQFGFDDGATTGNRVYEPEMPDDVEEGGFTPNYRDLDGSFTGTANSTIVRTTPFHLTDKCYTRANWQLSACPYRYGKLHIIRKTTTDIENEEGGWPALKLFLMRDDVTDFKERHDLEQTAQTDEQAFGVILGGKYSYTVNWETKIHPYIELRAEAVERDFPVRVGLCIPRDATFDLYRTGIIKVKGLDEWESVNSVGEVDADTTGRKYFFDSTVGLLFVKFLHPDPLIPYYHDCPSLKCDVIKLWVLSGDLTDADCSGRAYGPYKKVVQDSTPVMTQDNLKMTSATPPANMGARETRPFATRTPVDGGFGEWGDWEPCSVTCGGGTQVKRRLCDNPLPEHGGANCDESTDARYETRVCNEQAC